jgi:hypothetical protein
MRRFCLFCFKLNLKAANKDGNYLCYGYCTVYKVYKYSPYHNCTKAVMVSNPEGWHKWLISRSAGLKAVLERFEEEMPKLMEES